MLPKESHRKGEDSHMSGFVCAVTIVGHAPDRRADSNSSLTSSARINKYNKKLIIILIKKSDPSICY